MHPIILNYIDDTIYDYFHSKHIVMDLYKHKNCYVIPFPKAIIK